MKNSITYKILSSLVLVFIIFQTNIAFANDIIKNENKNWNFYWKEFISYEQIKDSHLKPDAKINIPNYWTDVSSDLNTTGHGYGTYHKQFILPHNFKTPLGIHIEGIDVAYKLFVNNNLVKECGTIATNKEDEVPQYQSTIIQFIPPSDTINLIIQVSNFHHRRGGIWKKIEIDEYELLSLRTEKVEFSDDVSLSIMFAFGIFFSIFYFFNRQEKTLPLFGLTFIAIFLTGITTNFYPITIISNISWANTIRLEYIGHFASLAFLIWAFYNILPLKWLKLSSTIITSILIIFAITTVFTTVNFFSYLILIFYGLLAIAILAAILQFSLGLRSNFKVSFLIIIGISALILAALNDIIISLGYNALTNNYVLNRVFIFFLLVLSVGFFNAYSNRYNKEKSLRKSLSFANTSLEKIIDEHTEELYKNQKIINDQNKSLSQENYIKNKVLSIIGHDLRSPIASVIQDLDLLDLIDDRELEKTAIENVKQSVESLYNMVDNLLSWALNKEHRLKYRPEAVNMSEMVQNVISQNIHIARNKKISINSTVEDLKPVICDIYTTSIIIRNLLSNAIKFTPENGNITFLSECRHNSIILEIRDDGVGMSKDRIAEILEGENHTSTEGTNIELGTGIGLSLVKDFIELNNGQLAINSKEGEGTSIFITLPTEK